MNGKKISGNASKATLPGGQKLSDKIQENKVKQGLNNNQNKLSSNNIQDNVNGKENSKQNNKNDNKGKLANTAQGLGSEALKKSLKAAFPVVPQFIINKLVDSKIGQALIEKTLTKTKNKIVFGLVVGVSTFLMFLLILAAFAAAIASPLSFIGDVVKSIGGFFVSIWNSAIGKGWCATETECQTANEEKYYEKLTEALNKYKGSCTINPNLITATIFYGQMVSEEGITDTEAKEGEKDDAPVTYYDYSNVSETSVRYKTADSQISKLIDVYLTGEEQAVAENSQEEDLKDYESCSFADDKYKEYLINTYIDWAYPSVITENRTKEKIADEILTIGEVGGYGSNDYLTSDLYNSSCSYDINGEKIDNLKVKLINGTNSDNPGELIEGEELISFEKYILGVVYGEVGNEAPDEVIKARAIAARSYALTYGEKVNSNFEVGLHMKNGEWTLTIINSTETQVYCDPDKGCSKIGDENSTVYSDPDKYNKYKGPLSEDDRLRTIINAVTGKVILDNNGDIVYTPYTSINQEEWIKLANEGKDYSIILKETYSEMTTINNGNCSALYSYASGPYTEWKQANYSNTVMGTETIKDGGCLTVSVCMQVARSGVETPLGENFAPDTFVEAYRNYLYGRENGKLGNNWAWYGITKVIPNFVYDYHYRYENMHTWTDEEQINALMKGINAGCYYVVEVKSYYSGQHWVAIDTIKDGEIYILDPASNCNKLSECKASKASGGFKYRINTASCYRVK